MITSEAAYQDLAKGFVIGTRLHSAPVVRLADAKPVHLGHTIKVDGRWRLFAFAGPEEPAAAKSGIRGLCEFLADGSESPVRRYTPTGEHIDSAIDGPA